jgi:hypothetical protein
VVVHDELNAGEDKINIVGHLDHQWGHGFLGRSSLLRGLHLAASSLSISLLFYFYYSFHLFSEKMKKKYFILSEKSQFKHTYSDELYKFYLRSLFSSFLPSRREERRGEETRGLGDRRRRGAGGPPR